MASHRPHDNRRTDYRFYRLVYSPLRLLWPILLLPMLLLPQVLR